MENLKLIRPSYSLKTEIEDYRQEHILVGEPRIHGSAGLYHYDKIDDWLRDEEHNRRLKTASRVPADTYLLYDTNQNRILGMVQIRHELNEGLRKIGGHIGYGLRPSERRRGYGKKMLALALEKARELELQRVLITCDKDNVASARTIIANGGILENEIEVDGIMIQRYWIEL